MSTNTAASHYLESNILKWLTQNTQMPAPPATTYVRLYTVMPAEDGTGGTEVSTAGGSAYAPIAVSSGASGTGVGSGWSAITNPDSTSSQVSNGADLLYAVAGASWGTIVGVAVWDASSGGNMLYYGVADTAVPINSGDQYRIAAGALKLNAA